GRVRRATHPVEVRARVRAPDEHVAVAPRLLAEAPRLGIVVRREWPQDSAQIVGDDDVEQGVEGRLTALAREVTHDATLQPAVDLGVRVADLVAGPVREAGEDAGIRRL